MSVLSSSPVHETPGGAAGRVVAICGGVGGAKLAAGLHDALEPGRLTVIVNTGDDFEHMGLSISPDIDTVLYTLSGLADAERGWGRAGESWQFMSAVGELGGEQWFQLGDQDLALHVQRTHALRGGESLTSFVGRIAARIGIRAEILPMTDAAVRTMVETDEGTLAFQRYFVERRCAPAVRALRFDGAANAEAPATALAALADPSLSAIVICPSNPYLSIDPILAIPGLAAALARSSAPVIAVSPIIGGQAVKGPTVKIMAELGISATTQSIAAHYRGLIDGLVIDEGDTEEAAHVEVPVHCTQTLMRDPYDRTRLAHEVLAFAETLANAPVSPVTRRPAAGVVR